VSRDSSIDESMETHAHTRVSYPVPRWVVIDTHPGPARGGGSFVGHHSTGAPSTMRDVGKIRASSHGSNGSNASTVGSARRAREEVRRR